MSNKKNSLGKVLFGIGVGVGLGMLFAPRKGTETRKILKEKLEDLYVKAKDINPSDVKDSILKKISEIKEELKELDKEKVLDIAKEQAKVIQKKAEELYKYALKKGTPILEKAADEVRVQAIKVAKEVVERLEKPESKKTSKK